MRIIAVVVLLAVPIGACARQPPAEGASTVSIPSAGEPISAPASTPSTTMNSTDPPDQADGHACEPIVRCGVWSGCVWLDHIGPGRYRARQHGDKGEVFVRRHECWPADAGLAGCAVHCTGPDAGPPCHDGLHPEYEVCTGAAVPRPNSAACLLGGGICGSLM